MIAVDRGDVPGTLTLRVPGDAVLGIDDSVADVDLQ